MKKSVYLLMISLTMVLPGVSNAADWNGNFNVFLGGKALDKDDWKADEQAEVGFRLDFKRYYWPFSIAADVHFSKGDFSGQVFFPGIGTHFYEEDVETGELNFGLRKYWDSMPGLRPFLGGGLAYAQLNAEGVIDGATSFSDKGDGFGAWVNGGILWSINAFNIGFDLRYTKVQVGLDVGDFEGGGGHAGLLLGYRW